MDLLDRFESILRSIVDGGIMSRLARTVQPSEIARRLANEMEFNTGAGFVGPTGRIAPNDFTVRLNPEDFKEYAASHSAVEAHIAGYLEDYAARQGLTLLGPVAVHLVAEKKQARHTLGISPKVEGEEPEEAPSQPERPRAVPSAPSSSAVVAASGTAYLLDMASGSRVPLDDRPITLGRGLDNTLVANNEYVSRSHAEIRARNGRYYLRDLRSRNGTFLNGRRVEGERELGPNDTISLGPEPVGLRYRFEKAGPRG